VANKDKVKRSPAGRVPTNAPRHNRALSIALIIGFVGLAFMLLWFWMLVSGGGILLTDSADQDAVRAAKLEKRAARAAAQDEARREKAAAAAQLPESGDVDLTPQPEPEPADPLEAPTEVPQNSETVTEQWDFSSWSVLSKDDKLVVTGNLENVSGEAQSGELRLYVYTNDQLVATAPLNVVDFPTSTSERVEFESSDRWLAGPKTLVLRYQSD